MMTDDWWLWSLFGLALLAAGALGYCIKEVWEMTKQLAKFLPEKKPETWVECSIDELAEAWGITPDKVKMNLLQGEELPKGFRVMPWPSGEIVYFQRLKKGKEND